MRAQALLMIAAEPQPLPRLQAVSHRVVYVSPLQRLLPGCLCLFGLVEVFASLSRRFTMNDWPSCKEQ